MDLLTLYGFIAVALMLTFYAFEDRSTWFVLAFSAACILAAIYGALQGAWPFAILEAIWAFIAFRKWRRQVEDAEPPAMSGPPV